MAEILIRVADKVHSDPARNAQCTKRGDVIVVCEDGHVWGEAEKTSPFWRIVSLPNVTVSEASMWLGPEPQVDIVAPSRMVQRRLWTLDLATLFAAAPDALADDTRRAAKVVFAGRFAQIQGAATRKPVLDDPRNVGENPRVL